MKWNEGKPPECGYYLAAFKLHPGHMFPTVSELWFNGSKGEGSWWASRGYLEGFGGRSPFLSQQIATVTHWAEMPEPPVEAHR